MELTQLKYFLEVARTEHVTQSAKNLGLAAPGDVIVITGGVAGNKSGNTSVLKFETIR